MDGATARPAPAAAGDIVRLSDVAFAWPGKEAFTLAVRDFALPARERILLIGPSGSGKSTFLSLICGILTPQAGASRCSGRTSPGWARRRAMRFRAEHFGIVFQMFNLLPYASVIDNVLLPLSFAPGRRRRATAKVPAAAEARRLLARLGLDAGVLRSRSAANLSVGQQQRVAAARALIGRPEIVVADEPTSALDRDRQEAFLDLLFAEVAAAGATLLMVSHDREPGPRFDRVGARSTRSPVSSAARHAMIVLRLALNPCVNRWVTALLTVLAIAASVVLLLGVEKVRTGARQSFADTISGTDLIVGARSGNLQLLLYAVFRIGNATNNVTWQSYQDIAARPEVAWIVPLSLGDSHHGFRVLGTTPEYFEHYSSARARAWRSAHGKPFADLFDAVIGADVAAKLGYKVGDPIVVAHGLGSVSFVEHDDKPFRVGGHPGADRHAGRPHRARQPGGDRGDPRRLAERGAGAGPIDLCRGRAQDGPEAEGHHRRAGGSQVAAHRVPAAARHQRVSGRAAHARSCRERRCRSCGASSAQPKPPWRWSRPWSWPRHCSAC